MKKHYLFLLIFVIIIVAAMLFLFYKNFTKVPSQRSNSYIGSWHRNQEFNNATLTITGMDKKYLQFELVASHGANTGELSGEAKAYDEKNFLYIEKTGDTECRLSITLQQKLIKVNHVDKKGTCGAGLNVSYSGTYLRKEDITKRSLKTKGIFTTVEQEKAFKSLVGSDYELFQDSMQKIIPGDNNDTSNIKVFSGALQGMYTLRESIIMYDDKGSMWAATIDSSTNIIKVKYFTNIEKDKKKLPAEIEKWRERFKDYEVINMSDK